MSGIEVPVRTLPLVYTLFAAAVAAQLLGARRVASAAAVLTIIAVLL